ncbi:dynactin 4 [Ditylenchus destructor]|uniref:Dynactin 4 n=1 Tax=Ditylenchus destructor TaxID=166010 RepID=A0AAD4NEK3_9BILA|nr:dynactin 4 [Ditylenchus destructor]
MYNCDEIWPVYETDQDYAAVVYPEFQEDFKTDTDIVWGTLETYQHDNTDVSYPRDSAYFVDDATIPSHYNNSSFDLYGFPDYGIYQPLLDTNTVFDSETIALPENKDVVKKKRNHKCWRQEQLKATIADLELEIDNLSKKLNPGEDDIARIEQLNEELRKNKANLKKNLDQKRYKDNRMLRLKQENESFSSPHCFPTEQHNADNVEKTELGTVDIQELNFNPNHIGYSPIYMTESMRVHQLDGKQCEYVSAKHGLRCPSMRPEEKLSRNGFCEKHVGYIKRIKAEAAKAHKILAPYRKRRKLDPSDETLAYHTESWSHVPEAMSCSSGTYNRDNPLRNAGVLTKKEVLKQYLAALERENEAIENVRKLFAEKIRRVDSSFFEKLQDSTYDQDDVFE